MGCHEKLMNYGDWTVSLTPETPVEILKALDEGMFGTVYITPSRITDAVHPKEVARYAGIMRSREFTETQRVIGGSGLVWLLGDPNTPGPGVDETAIDLTGQSFVNAVTAVLADTDLVPGNIIAESGALPNGRFIGHTARYKLERILSQYSEAEYRVTPKAELDAGTPASLFPTFNNPTVFIKRGASGVDPDWTGVPLQSGAMGKDLTNWANRKLLVNNLDGEFTIVGEADQATSFRGPNGTLLSFTDVSVESEQGQANADVRAAALLGHLVKERKIVRLVTENYDVFGSFGLGDTLFVWEPEIGFYDLSNKIEFRGQWYFPLALRVYGFDWPIKEGMGVWFQSSKPSADLYDLTDYFIPEEGQTTIDVGSAARTLVPAPTEPLGPVVAPITNPSDPPPAPDSPTIFGNERQLLVQAPVTSGGDPLPTNVRKLNVYASTTSGFTPGPTNIIGYISVSQGNIKLGTDVIKRFPWPEDQQTYVRISALNATAEGPASAEVAVTAGLIPSAAIISLVADKIAAGTISASVEMTAAIITGGLIRAGQTSSPFNYWEGDDAGLRAKINGSSAYTGGTSTFEFDIATGDTFFTGEITGSTITGGTIRTASSGQRVAMEASDFDRLKWYTGDASENLPGIIFSFIGGSGATRTLSLQASSPRLVTHASRGFLDLVSRGADASGEARGILSAQDSTGATKGMFNAQENFLSAILLPTGDGLRVNTSQVEVRSVAGGLLLNAQAGDALVNAGDDIILDATDIVSFNTNGTARMRIQGSLITLDGHDLRLRSLSGTPHEENYLRYNNGINGADLGGYNEFKVFANIADVMIRGIHDASAPDIGGAIYASNAVNTPRKFQGSSFEVVSDEKYKSEVADVLPTQCSEYLRQIRVRHYRMNGNPSIGVVAQELPDGLRRSSRFSDADGNKDAVQHDVYSLNELAAVIAGSTKDAHERLDKLQAALDKIVNTKEG